MQRSSQATGYSHRLNDSLTLLPTTHSAIHPRTKSLSETSGAVTHGASIFNIVSSTRCWNLTESFEFLQCGVTTNNDNSRQKLDAVHAGSPRSTVTLVPRLNIGRSAVRPRPQATTKCVAAQRLRGAPPLVTEVIVSLLPYFLPHHRRTIPRASFGSSSSTHS